MKTFIYFIFFLIVFSSFSQENTELKHSNYFDAAKESYQKGKIIMLYFKNSDSCESCQDLEKNIFEKDIFKNFSNDNLEFVEIDLSNKNLTEEKYKENLKLKEQFNITWYPQMVFVYTDTNNDKEKLYDYGYVLKYATTYYNYDVIYFIENLNSFLYN